MRLSDEVIDVLSRSTIEGNALTLPDGQLDRSLYLKVDKALKALGGKWNRKQRAHLFESSPGDAIADALENGTITDEKQELQFFETPYAIAHKLMAMADLKAGMTVLEPSAGKGAIARHLAAGGWRPVCVEKHKPFVDHLEENGHAVEYGDFLQWVPDQEFDRVIMNPPFSKQQDITHVLHAWLFLKAGGVLVSVMSAGVLFRENKKTKLFRKFVEDNGGEFTKLSEGAFRGSGTMVNAVIVRIPCN